MILNGQSRYTAACYCRLSRDDEQDGTSISIETQKKVLEDYCNINNYGVYDFYCDDGFSGTNFDRPSFKRMMSDVQNGIVNMVVVKDLSRFGRNYIEVGKYIEEVFPEKGIRFIAIGDDVDSERENLDLDLMLPLKNIFNQYYPADCSRKTRQALAAKAKRGEFIGSQAPYGYKKSEEDKHVLVIDKETAPIVKWIFEMAAYQGYGYNKIARVLSERKIITPAALQAQRSRRNYEKDPYEWNFTTVHKMMQNRSYLGHLISGKRRKMSFKSKREIKQSEDKWIVVENTHEPLISEQLWNDAQKSLKSRKRTSKMGNVNIFAGLLKCDKCGYALGIANASNRQNHFCCTTYKKKGKDKCSIHYTLYDDLYEIVLTDVRQMLRAVQKDKDRFIQIVQNKIGKSESNDRKAIDYEINVLQTRIKELDMKFDRLYDDRLDGLLSEKKFKDLSGKCEMEQEKLNARLSELNAEMQEQKDKDTNVEQFTDLISQYDKVMELDKELLNRLIDKIVVSDRIKVDDGYYQKVSIHYKFIGELE